MQPAATRGQAVPLKRWLWRSYLRAALVPLLLIELGFVAIYWVTAQVVYDRSAAAITRISTETLHDAALREAKIIGHRLQAISALTGVFAGETGRALATPATVSQAEQDRHAMTPEGTFYTTRDTGGAAVFYSGAVPVGPAQKEKLWRTVRLDPLMKAIKSADPLIGQIYLNTHDSLNRIYPYFDVLAIYPPKMDIPSYNFYYEADAAHDPGRKPVWTDAYVDPAGGGWMVSSIAPVWSPERLEGVVGIDVTVGTIVQQVLNIEIPGEGYGVLVGRDGTILALPPKGEADLGVSELVGHSYEEAILKDTFKPDAFNIFKRPGLAGLAAEMQARPEGATRLDLGRPMFAAWSQVAGPNWLLVVLTSEEQILAPSATLSGQLALVSQGMLAILAVFYAGFFGFLWRRSAAMSERVAQPLGDLESRMAVIAEGGRPAAAPPGEIEELRRVADHLVVMSDKLEAANRAKASFLASMSHELRTPLSAIIGYADLLEGSEGMKLDGERLAQVRAISAAGWALVRLIDVVLDLSGLDSPDARIATQPLDLRPLLETAVAEERAAALRAGLRLSLDLPAALPKVRAEPARLARIFAELLSNAVKYTAAMGPGGAVEIGISLAVPGEMALRIADTGPGIAPEHHADVFKAFQRLGQETGAIGGAGIGLAIAKRYADVLGLGLEFESEPGRGTVFTLRLPLV